MILTVPESAVNHNHNCEATAATSQPVCFNSLPSTQLYYNTATRSFCSLAIIENSLPKIIPGVNMGYFDATMPAQNIAKNHKNTDTGKYNKIQINNYTASCALVNPLDARSHYTGGTVLWYINATVRSRYTGGTVINATGQKPVYWWHGSQRHRPEVGIPDLFSNAYWHRNARVIEIQTRQS